MEPFENPDEGFKTSSAKVVFGIRISPELKETLFEEAIEAGISTSEYGEMILANRYRAKAENERLTLIIVGLQKENERLKLQTSGNDAEQLELFSPEREEQLLLHIESLNKQLAILRDQQLLYLFDQVRDLRDTIHTPDGRQYSIQYNTPYDLLRAMIYSYKLKK